MFDDEPHVIILHLNVYAILDQHLNLFNGIVTIVDTLDALLNQLAGSNRALVVVALLPEHISQQFQDFNQINFQQYTNVDYIYSLYREYLQFVTIKRDRHRQLLKTSRSITDDTLEKVKFICSKTFDRNMKYCKERAQQSARNGDNGIAALYQEQWLKRCQFQEDIIQQLLDSI